MKKKRLPIDIDHAIIIKTWLDPVYLTKYLCLSFYLQKLYSSLSLSPKSVVVWDMCTWDFFEKKLLRKVGGTEKLFRQKYHAVWHSTVQKYSIFARLIWWQSQDEKIGGNLWRRFWYQDFVFGEKGPFGLRDKDQYRCKKDGVIFASIFADSWSS